MSLFSTILSKLGFAKEAVAQPLTQPAAEAAAGICAGISCVAVGICAITDLKREKNSVQTSN